MTIFTKHGNTKKEKILKNLKKALPYFRVIVYNVTRWVILSACMSLFINITEIDD